MKMNARTPKSLLAAAIGVAIATSTYSQIVSAQGRQLEEVIVTAQKRAQSSQDVPIALAAISSEMLDQMGIAQTQDLTKVIPALTVSIGDNKQNSGFRLRGIGTSVFSVGVEQSVAVIIDDVSTVQAGQSLSNLVDIERIEVLLGPQSTLFGKSASAGVVSVVTKAPSEEFEGFVEVSATDDDEERVVASLSGPITDTLGYRISGHWSDRDGFVKNLSTGDDVNSEESKGIRGKLRWQISDAAEATLTAYRYEDESTCCALTWLDLDPAAQVFGFVPGEIAEGFTPSDDNLDFRSEDGPVDEQENTGVNLRVTVDMGDFTLTSITASDEWEYSNDGDVDFSNVDVFGFFTGGAVSGGFFSQSNTKTDFFSQEFRLASQGDGNLDYVVGLYYAEADTDRSFLRNPGLSLIPSDWNGTAKTESVAVFGQATWRISDATSVTAGLRYNDEEISVDFSNNLLDPLMPLSGDDSDSEVLGNISFQYFMSDDIMLYARYAQGYKGQAYDITTSFDQTRLDNPAAPETSDSYEFGIKSTVWDQRLRLNASVFFTEYEDYQAQSTVVQPDGTLTATLNNVGSLETQGLELEGIALLGENLSLTFAAAYIDATIEEFNGADCYGGQTPEQGCIDGLQDISGGDLPNSPEWKYSFLADYQAEFSDLPFDGFANLSWVWQDEVTFGLLQNPETKHDSYGVVDLSIGISESENDRYRITAFVNNVTDENYRSTVTDLGLLYGGATAFVQSFGRNSQRYAGVRVKYSF